MSEHYVDTASLRAAMIEEFCALARVDAQSGHEGAVSDIVVEKLKQLGFQVLRDNAGKHIGGESGNVIGRLCGERTGEPILLCAHLDRVAPGNGVRPVVNGDRIVSSGDTVLGADDLAGVVSLLTGIRLAQAECACLPPLEVVFTVSEEQGLAGSRYMDYSAVTSRIGYVLDAARPVGVVVVAGPTHVGFEVSISGRAAHAAINPEDGISAIQIAAEAVSRIPFGRIDDRTTSNIGVVVGGYATNIVCDRVTLSGEVRSLDHSRALGLTDEFAARFRETAKKRGGSADVSTAVHYPCYNIPSDSKVVVRVQRALSRAGRAAILETSMGGSDANMFNYHGIESVCLGVGFEQVHSCRESISASELVAAAELVRDLILSAE